MRIYARHFAFVWRCLRALGVPPEGLDDAAQDVFLVVHRRLSTFRGESALRSWLFGITRNVGLNRRRGNQRGAGRQEPLADEPPSTGPGPLERAQDAEAAAFVERFLATVGDKKRDVFLLAILEEMSIPEVAEALSIPLNTAYTRLRGVRADFQQALQRRRGTP